MTQGSVRSWYESSKVFYLGIVGIVAALHFLDFMEALTAIGLIAILAGLNASDNTDDLQRQIDELKRHPQTGNQHMRRDYTE